jgi:hypothetical protein
LGATALEDSQHAPLAVALFVATVLLARDIGQITASHRPEEVPSKFDQFLGKQHEFVIAKRQQSPLNFGDHIDRQAKYIRLNRLWKGL